jgi:hypothetical protein
VRRQLLWSTAPQCLLHRTRGRVQQNPKIAAYQIQGYERIETAILKPYGTGSLTPIIAGR